MFVIVRQGSVTDRRGACRNVRFCEEASGQRLATFRNLSGRTMLVSEKQLTSEQSRMVATTVREEIARRRISRQQLADRAIAERLLDRLARATAEGGRQPHLEGVVAGVADRDGGRHGGGHAPRLPTTTRGA